MGYVRRKATTKSKLTLSDSAFKDAKAAYLHKISKAVADGKIPPDLIINWDQTGVKVVPSSEWTQEERGTARVEIAGVDDKRQITVTSACALSGELLPFQVLHEGKTVRCHPSNSATFPQGCDVWHTPNHWANAETSVRFVNNIRTLLKRGRSSS